MTYKELLNCLSKLSERQLNQQVMVYEGSVEINTVRIDNNVWLSEREPPLVVFNYEKFKLKP